MLRLVFLCGKTLWYRYLSRVSECQNGVCRLLVWVNTTCHLNNWHFCAINIPQSKTAWLWIHNLPVCLWCMCVNREDNFLYRLSRRRPPTLAGSSKSSIRCTKTVILYVNMVCRPILHQFENNYITKVVLKARKLLLFLWSQELCLQQWGTKVISNSVQNVNKENLSTQLFLSD
jgi:hypothetical protein